MKRIHTTFQKLALAFLMFGVLPLLLVCLLSMERYEANARLTVESIMEEASYFALSKTEGLLQTLDRQMGYLYDYSDEEHAALYELLADDSLNENQKKLYIGGFLDHFIQADPAVSAAYFAVSDHLYYRIYDQQKSMRFVTDSYHRLPEEATEQPRQLYLLPQTDEGAWCNGSSDQVISLARNYMDVRTLDGAAHRPLGTLYVDVRTDALDGLLSSLRLGAGGNVAVADEQGNILYRLRGDVDIPMEESVPETGRFSRDGLTVFCQGLGSGGLRLLVSFDEAELYSAYTSSRVFVFVALAIAVTAILILGLLLSSRMSQPARELQQAMRRVQEGDLSTRVDIHSRDELEELGEGFNRMAEKLDKTIQEVYLAQLCQRDAELNALKMQIRPHYLYNTLDVIRMSALEQGDGKTARLIESLSGQLRYLTGNHRDRVSLRQELDSVREYAVLLEARYEGRITVELEAANRDLDLLVPKLLIQPFVENAVKHGLRDKLEGGTVLVEAVRLADCLQLVVLNDGLPIEPERLEHIRSFLASSAVGERDPAGIVSTGMKNTYDRIKLNCGSEYGFTLDSGDGAGAIVTIRLPIWEEGSGNVEGPAG